MSLIVGDLSYKCIFSITTEKPAPDIPTTARLDHVNAEVAELREYLREHPERTLSDPQEYVKTTGHEDTFTYVSYDLKQLIENSELSRQQARQSHKQQLPEDLQVWRGRGKYR